MNGFLFWHKLILQKKNSQEKWTNKNINMHFFKKKKLPMEKVATYHYKKIGKSSNLFYMFFEF